MDVLLAFLSVVLAALPPLRVYMRQDDRRPVHLYTDAAYNKRGRGRPRPSAGRLGPPEDPVLTSPGTIRLKTRDRCSA